MVVLADAGTGLRIGAVVTAFAFGFRHGIDWDHLAAIGDITGSQTSRRRSLRLATCYAAGHAVVVLALGLAAVLLSRRLPGGVDDVMERVVGASLLFLGVWVLVGLARRGPDFRLRSRWMLLFALGRSCIRRLRPTSRDDVVVVVHDHAHDPATGHHHHHDGEHVGVDAMPSEALARAGQPTADGNHGHDSAGSTDPPHRHVHRHIARMPADPFVGYGSGTSFLVGMLHGVGAETPTQVLVLVTAAGVGGSGAGVLVLLAFIAGLLTSNTVVALAGALGFASAARNFRAYAAVSIVTAIGSIAVGLLFLTGSAGALPVISG
jgi:high-affinity nickel-transport protein